MKKLATVICSRCGKQKKQYGIRTEKINNKWFFTWTFPIKEEVAKREGYSDTVINDTPSTQEGFPGCPFCNSKDMIYCDGCHKLNCYNGEEKFTCQWCGNTGNVTNNGWGSLSGGGY